MNAKRLPNIVLIMSDNQPADLLGCYGNDEVSTPYIDGLAARGTQFANAYCVNAMCSPCRASVMTGLMPSQHGIHNWLDDTLASLWPHNWSAISEFNTLPKMFKQQGYKTALIGKFHLGIADVPQLAFDHWVTFPHGHTTSFYGNDVIDQEKRYRFEGHTVDFFTDKTVDFIEAQSANEPFFAFVPYNGPYGHWPAIKDRADNEFAEIYDDLPMNSIPREGLDSAVLDRFGLRVAQGGVREQFKGPLLLPNNIQSLRNYFSQVSLIDAGVGRILDALGRMDMTQDTIVIYTADHGFSLGHNGIWGHGAAAFPASAHRHSYHIPLIIAGDGLQQGHKNHRMVSQIDLFPTLATMIGSDMVPSLPSAARDIVNPTGNSDAIFYEQEETRAIRTQEWMYAMRFKGSEKFPMSDQLFDLRKDPQEKINLIDDPSCAPIIERLRQQLITYFETYSVPKYDLWTGGSAKSNVTYAPLWQDAWGDTWAPELPS